MVFRIQPAGIDIFDSCFVRFPADQPVELAQRIPERFVVFVRKKVDHQADVQAAHNVNVQSLAEVLRAVRLVCIDKFIDPAEDSVVDLQSAGFISSAVRIGHFPVVINRPGHIGDLIRPLKIIENKEVVLINAEGIGIKAEAVSLDDLSPVQLVAHAAQAGNIHLCSRTGIIAVADAGPLVFADPVLVICRKALVKDTDPGPFVSFREAHIRNDQVRSGAKVFIIQNLQSVFVHPVVRINKSDRLSPGCVQTGIACPADSLVFLIDMNDTGIFPGILPADSTAPVGGSVVDEDALKIGEALGEQRFNAGSDVFLCVIYRNDDTDLGIH